MFAAFLSRVAREAVGAASKLLAVVYGAANFAPGGRGERAMPTSRAFKECVQPYKTVLVDEFKTAVVHVGDGLVMK